MHEKLATAIIVLFESKMFCATGYPIIGATGELISRFAQKLEDLEDDSLAGFIGSSARF